MKVKIKGFSWFVGAGITTQSFLKYLEHHSPLRHKNYILGVTRKADYWAGVLLTVKDHKSICLIKPGAQNAFEVIAEALHRDEKLVEFNFFLMKEKTGRGLYQHYRGSTSLNTFFYLAARFYRQHRNELRAAAYAKPDADRKAIREQYKGALTYQIIVKPENFAALVAKLSRIKAFQVQLGTIHPVEAAFLPIAAVAKQLTERFTFTSDAHVVGAGRIMTTRAD